MTVADEIKVLYIFTPH